MFVETKWVKPMEEWLRHNQIVENYEFFEYGEDKNLHTLELTFWGDKSLTQIREVLDKLSFYEYEKPKLIKYKCFSIVLKEYEFEAESEEIALDLLKERELEDNETVLVEDLGDLEDYKSNLTYKLQCYFGLDTVSKMFKHKRLKDYNNEFNK